MHPFNRPSSAITLPPLSEGDKTHSDRCRDFLVAQINAHGPMCFADFMSIVLAHPQWGYYQNIHAASGALGDFMTASSYSSLYAKTLAQDMARAMQAAGLPDVFEVGPGNGAFAEHCLRALADLKSLPKTYHLLTISASLEALQRERLMPIADALGVSLKWWRSWPAPAIEAVVVINEVLDALPVMRFRCEKAGLLEPVLCQDNGRLNWQWQQAATALSDAVSQLEVQLGEPFINGYESEICMCLAAWFSGLSSALVRSVVWVVDYGHWQSVYYHPERSMGTLRCYYRQHAHDDPLWAPGVQDVTAHVDFTAAALAAEAAGFVVSGVVPQASYLCCAGIGDLLPPVDDVTYRLAVTEVKKLTSPREMGEAFKVMVLQKGCEVSCRGLESDG